jgi:hypothetical protein
MAIPHKTRELGVALGVYPKVLVLDEICGLDHGGRLRRCAWRRDSGNHRQDPRD